MAVAVKNTPEVGSSSLLNHPALVSLVGGLYVLACLAIVFKLIPSLFWQAWEGLNGTRGFVGGSLMGVVMLAAAVGLLVVGGKLLGSHPPAGVRAGIFVGLVGYLVVVLLTRWFSVWMEHWVFHDYFLGANGPQVGAIITAAVGVVLLLAWVRLFTRPGTQGFVQRLEAAGWFSATSYKGSQGQKVRRGTIFGILLLVGAGIYTLVTHGTLRKTDDWVLDIPFTGTVAVTSVGDTRRWLADAEGAQVQVVRLKAGGDNLEPPRDFPPSAYRDQVLAVVKEEGFPKEVGDKVEKATGKPTIDLILAVNGQLLGEIQRQLAGRKALREDSTRDVRELAVRTDPADVVPLVREFLRRYKSDNSSSADLPSPVFNLPLGVLVVNRYALRDINDKTDPSKPGHYVRVGFNENDDVIKLKEGDIVSKAEFDEKVAKGEEEAKKEGREVKAPDQVPLTAAGGQTHYASLTLLPAVQYTVPLLLLVLSLWLAWRVVNMPAFADFLIATEAELNKVSWTTQRRLVQDTVVVLTTVVLMAAFLFLMDQAWRILLSSRPVGVLIIPKESGKKPVDEKDW
jgi:preprotein translocase SecE subunit